MAKDFSLAIGKCKTCGGGHMIREMPIRFPLALALLLLVTGNARSASDSSLAGLGDADSAPAWHAAASGNFQEAALLLSRLTPTANTRRLERILAEQATVPLPEVRLDPSSPSIAMRTARNGTPLVEVSVNGARLEMGVDTGAGLSVITRSVAKRVNARPLAGLVPDARDSLGKAVASDLFVVDVVVGGMEALNVPVLVVDDARLRASVLGVTLFSFDGLVGWNVLSRARVVVDFAEKKISLGPPRRDCAARNLFSLGFKPLVEVRLNQQPTLALVDLGARTSFALSGAPWVGGESPDTEVFAGASGSAAQPVSVMRDVDLQLPGRKASLARLSIRDRGARDDLNSLTLGLDVIGAGTLTLDFPCGEFLSSR